MVSTACRARGSLKDVTPLAMASTPVIAVHPDEKARRTRKTLSAGTAEAAATGAAGSAAGRVPKSQRYAPAARSTPSERMKP